MTSNQRQTAGEKSRMSSWRLDRRGPGSPAPRRCDSDVIASSRGIRQICFPCESLGTARITRAADDGCGPMSAMAMALEDAAIAPEAIGHINAHATSTPAGDRLESRAIRTLFGAHCAKLSVSSTKSVTGHLLGA